MNNFTITIVGNNNVGKSSLFNFITKSTKALVYNMAGVTIDRIYGSMIINTTKISCIDTISYKLSLEKNLLDNLTLAIKEANIILFVVDAIIGLTYHDINLSKFIQTFNKQVFLLVNKIESKKNIDIFWQLGYQYLYPISLQRKIGVHKFYKTLKEQILFDIKHKITRDKIIHVQSNTKCKNKTINKIVIIGLPNVGKSTLVNTIIKDQNRMVVHNMPGTTHDAVEIFTSYKENNYSIIDTAGICKSNLLTNKNIIPMTKRSLQMINQADLILFVLDANNPFCEQNNFILNYLLNKGRNFIIVVNKIDTIDSNKIIMLKKYIRFSFKFLKFTNISFISALNKFGIHNLLDNINNINNILKLRKINTSLLNKLMISANLKFNQNNDLFLDKNIKLKFAHLGGWNPILIIIHGKNVHKLSNNYKKYFINYFTCSLGIPGHQIKMYFKEIRK